MPILEWFLNLASRLVLKISETFSKFSEKLMIFQIAISQTSEPPSPYKPGDMIVLTPKPVPLQLPGSAPSGPYGAVPPSIRTSFL